MTLWQYWEISISKIIKLWNLYSHRWYYYCSKKDIQPAFVSWAFWFCTMGRHSKKTLLDIGVVTLGLETMFQSTWNCPVSSILFYHNSMNQSIGFTSIKNILHLHKPLFLDSVATSTHHSLSLQQMEIFKENHHWTQCRNQQILENLTPMIHL